MKPDASKPAEQAKIEGIQELSEADIDKVVGGVAVDTANAGADPTNSDSATTDMRKSGGDPNTAGKEFLQFRFK